MTTVPPPRRSIGPVAALIAALALPSSAGASIGGAVYRDYSGDGVRQTREVGIAGIAVAAYDDAGAQVATTTTAADGGYSLAGLSSGAKVRIEFSGAPAYLRPGADGRGTGSGTRFATEGDSGVNASFNNPTDFCEANPDLALNCFRYGDAVIGEWGGEAALRTIRDDATGAFATKATQTQIGATYGLAWRPSSRTIYASAFQKRHAGFGPAGPDGIYRVAPDGSVSTFFQADTVFGANSTGSDPHPSGQATTDTQGTWFTDVASWDAVGKVGFGDLDISEDERTLYAVNLARRTLVSIPVSNPVAATELAVTSPCAAGGYGTDADWRPFGLGVNDGEVYVGGVCSAESTTGAGAATGDPTDLAAYVLRRSGATWVTVLSTPLGYSKGRVETWDPSLVAADWNPWTPVWTTTPNALNRGEYPQPILSDIEFDGPDLVLGLRDRAGDQFGARTPQASPGATTPLYQGAIGGDTLRACPSAGGGWVLENAGACPGGTAGASQLDGQGPGGGEFYWGEDLAGTHEETSLGGLAQIPGRDQISTTIMDPNTVESGGIAWLSNTTGAKVRNAEEYVTTYGPTVPPTFGKANGLGDLEALCDAAPIEIGNRVWRDDSGDGVQDPGEPPLAGVTVRLYTATGSLVATTTTTANGQYAFSSAGPDLVPGTADDLGGHGADRMANTADDTPGLKPGGSYTVRIDNPGDYSGAGVLTGLVPTRAASGLEGGTATSDSNGVAARPTDVRADVTTGAAGANDYSYDFGFALPHSLGNRVWLDGDDSGMQNGDEPGAAGVTLGLFGDANRDCAPDGPALATATTDAAGHYLFDGLSPGDYLVGVEASNFEIGGPLAGRRSSTPDERDPNANGDANDNGIGAAGSARVLSCAVTLGGSEPLGEPGPTRGRASDDRSNLTVDFGFAPATASLGDIVWYDDDADGIQGTGEKGVAGVTVILLDAAGKEVARTTTGADGAYRFGNLAPGTYVVRFDTATLPKGYGVSRRNAPSASRANGSDAHPTTGRTASITLVAGQHDADWDMGIVRRPRLTISQKADRRTVRPGGTVRFVVTVRNVGGATARAVKVFVPKTPRTCFVRTPKGAKTVPGGLLVPVGNLAPRAGREVVVTICLSNTVRSGAVISTPTARSTNAATVAAPRIRVLAVTAPPPPVAPSVTG